jgi:hypothetical protein
MTRDQNYQRRKKMENKELDFYREAVRRLSDKDQYSSVEIASILLELYKESVGLGKEQLNG